MGKTEEDIKTESDTFALKRDYKYALEALAKVKKETAEIIVIKDKVVNELTVAQEELTKVKNEISQEKLDWTQFRHSELAEIESMKSEAENVLKRKAELNGQEEKIRQMELSDIEIRNETRRLVLDIEQDKRDLQGKKRLLEDERGKFEKEKSKFVKDKDNFKKKVIGIIKEVENIC